MTATNWLFQHHLHVFTGRCANTQDMQMCIQTCLNCPTLPISLILPCLSMTVWSICFCASLLNINGTLNAVSFVSAYTHVSWRGCACTRVAEVYKLIGIRYCLVPSSLWAKVLRGTRLGPPVLFLPWCSPGGSAKQVCGPLWQLFSAVVCDWLCLHPSWGAHGEWVGGWVDMGVCVWLGGWRVGDGWVGMGVCVWLGHSNTCVCVYSMHACMHE